MNVKSQVHCDGHPNYFFIAQFDFLIEISFLLNKSFLNTIDSLVKPHL